ncbi:hypothetical protein Kisp01_27890 [Kineosporia sp. NBRC 101677]|nr:hypothetical protein Kisp01_27890 [Kineosporia sp. NBRC 101677]
MVAQRPGERELRKRQTVNVHTRENTTTVIRDDGFCELGRIETGMTVGIRPEWREPVLTTE